MLDRQNVMLGTRCLSNIWRNILPKHQSFVVVLLDTFLKTSSSQLSKQVTRMQQEDTVEKSWLLFRPQFPRCYVEVLICLQVTRRTMLVGVRLTFHYTHTHTHTHTYIHTYTGGDFQAKTPEGRYIRFGVREHAMVAISNGLHAYGSNIVPACATFLTFTGYALGAMRVSALSGHQVLFVMTHDSIGLGEDGPTHQPIEHLAMLRAMPNMLVFRPCDGNETSGAYKVALACRGTPSTLALSRQKVSTLKGTAAEKVSRGAYIIQDCKQSKPSLILVGTGTEVGLCLEAKQKLSSFQVRVVSMPCWELYELQPDEYKRAIFPSGVPVLSVEAGSTCGWSKYSHGQIGIDRFGKSGPGPTVMNHFGFNVDNVVSKATTLMKFYASRGAPDLVARPF